MASFQVGLVDVDEEGNLPWMTTPGKSAQKKDCVVAGNAYSAQLPENGIRCIYCTLFIERFLRKLVAALPFLMIKEALLVKSECLLKNKPQMVL